MIYKNIIKGCEEKSKWLDMLQRVWGVRTDTEGTAENGLGAAYRSKYAKATTGAPVTVTDYR